MRGERVCGERVCGNSIPLSYFFGYIPMSILVVVKKRVVGIEKRRFSTDIQQLEHEP